MAKISVDDAPAGPAMDAAVARALGWYYGWGGWWEDEKGQVQKPACIGCDGKSTWSPSEDIAAAWEIWSQLCVEWHYAKLLFIENLSVEANLYQDSKAVMDKNPMITAIAKDGMLAVCRAFLKANGVEFVEAESGKDTS